MIMILSSLNSYNSAPSFNWSYDNFTFFFIIMLVGIMPLLFSSKMEIMERLDMQRIKRHNEILQGNYMTFVEEIEPRPAIALMPALCSMIRL